MTGKYIPEQNEFYQKYYHYFFYGLFGLVAAILITMSVIYYLLNTRPKPLFFAIDSAGKQLQLAGTTEPNLLPDTIIRFASKAAVMAYTYRFDDYDAQLAAVKPYFTTPGWAAFSAKFNKQVPSLLSKRLLVNGVVVGTPVISNQGELPNIGYAWRVQIPFLVTFQSAEETVRSRYTIMVTIVRVPTSVNPQGIGIDQFLTV